MPASLEAPPAAPAAPAAPAGGPGQVSAATIAPPVEPAPTARAGSAKSKMFDDLGKFVEKHPPKDSPQGTPTAPDAGAKPGEQPDPGVSPQAGKPAEGSTPPAGPPPEAGKEGKAGKVSPWKLVDEHKAARAAAEAKLAELQKLVPDPSSLEKQSKDLEAARARLAELEKTISYLDYSQSSDFQEKYAKPLQDAWQRVIGELGEIQVKIPGTDQIRQAKPDDLLQLMQLPLGEARALANAAFGDFADDVMNWRGKLRELSNAQSEALKNAKEQAVNWKKSQEETSKSTVTAINKFVTEIWSKGREEVLAHPEHSKWLKPVEGDAEVNSRLEKGFKLADEAFALNPTDPKLTPEQRVKAVRLHSALYHRAAAYGRLVHEVTKLQKQLSEVTKERDGLKGSAPPMSPGPSGQGTPVAPKGMAALQAALTKIAK